MNLDEPRYTHDCEKCTFLGQSGDYDLYHCLQYGNWPTIVARFGDDGPQYTSVNPTALVDPRSVIPELCVGYVLSVKRGLKLETKE